MIPSPPGALKIVSMAIYIVLSKLFLMPFLPHQPVYLLSACHLKYVFFEQDPWKGKRTFLGKNKRLTLVKKQLPIPDQSWFDL